jgi:signal-transduction protein with cAMP-binding, CBS, and nucleotidyltransferase domain
MMSRIALSRTFSTRLSAASNRLTYAARSFGTINESPSATDAWKASCYMEIDFTISDQAYAIEAIQKFAAFDIGCLITTDEDGKISGVISERDMITKVALKGKKAKDVILKDISTKDLVTATPNDSVDVCMNKMIQNDIRHLPILNDQNSVVGLLSIKDCAKAVLAEKEEAINTLSDFALGKGGTFVVD